MDMFAQYGEIAAVILALAYVVLAIRQHPACWLASATAALLYIFIFFVQRLYLESLLQAFYVGMACYGLWLWRFGAASKGPIKITQRALSWHVVTAISLLALSYAVSSVLTLFVDTDFAYLDSFTTLASLFTTWMVAKKIAENWLYWVVIDAIYVYLFLLAGLYLTAGLYVVFLGIALYGYKHWHQQIVTE